ncbi:TPA: hypothetical protein DCW54_01090 [Candidatus Dependentiae bacterium]|nr:hypothetical protein [Candidatus Dependentiae bacterium]
MNKTNACLTLSLLCLSAGITSPAESAWKMPIFTEDHFTTPAGEVEEFEILDFGKEKKRGDAEESLEQIKAEIRQKLIEKAAIRTKHGNLAPAYHGENYQELAQKLSEKIKKFENKLKKLPKKYANKFEDEQDQKRFLRGAQLNIPGAWIKTGSSDEERRNHKDLQEKSDIIKDFNEKKRTITLLLDRLYTERADLSNYFHYYPKQYRALDKEIKELQKQETELEQSLS